MKTLKKQFLILAIFCSTLTVVAQIENCTNCGVGETNPEAKLEIKGCGNTDATKALQITNSDDDVAVTVTDGLNVEVGDGALVFKNGVGYNLVSKYLSPLDKVNGDGKYVSIKTNIPFQNNAMMSSLKLSYWAYDRSYEMNLGWYTWHLPTLAFYQPNGHVTGITPSTVDFAKAVILSNDNGKVRISIPYTFFGVYGNLTVSSPTSNSYVTDDWYQNWEIVNDLGATGTNNQNVYLKNIGKSENTNIASDDLTFTEDRVHHLNGKKIRFHSGNIAIGNVDAEEAYTLRIGSDDDDWPLYMKNYKSDGHGAQINISGTSQYQYGLLVRSNGGSNPLFSVMANGNTGIGTLSPAYPLTVMANNNLTWAANIVQNQSNGYGLIIDHKSNENNRYSFKVRSGAALEKTAFLISSGTNPRVGIDVVTALPTEKLHVNKGNIRIDRGGNLGDPYLHLIPDNGEGDSWMMGIDDSGNKLSFAYGLSSGTTPFGTAADKMTIDVSGNIGIGTTNPTEKLEVYGKIKLGAASQEWIVSDGSIRLDLDNDNNQTDRAFIVSTNNGSNELLKVEENGDISANGTLEIDPLSGAGIKLMSSTPTSWNYIDFRVSATSRQAWMGIESQTGNLVFAKEGNGDIVLKGGRVKINQVLNLPVLSVLPTNTTGYTNGDVIIVNSGGSSSSMYVVVNNAWSPIN